VEMIIKSAFGTYFRLSIDITKLKESKIILRLWDSTILLAGKILILLKKRNKKLKLKLMVLLSM